MTILRLNGFGGAWEVPKWATVRGGLDQEGEGGIGRVAGRK